MTDLPIYKAVISDEIDGITAISLVESPAVITDFLKFNKEDMNEKLLFSVENEEERIIVGVIMRANFPIYRVSYTGYEYYIMYDEDTIKQMAEKLLKDNKFNQINLEHNGEKFVDGVELRELFIKNNERGISPKNFEYVEDGSLFATYHINNNELWQQIKNQEFKGFSLEGYFSMNEIKDNDTIDTIEELLDYINK